jgi:hypothetical protein
MFALFPYRQLLYRSDPLIKSELEVYFSNTIGKHEKDKSLLVTAMSKAICKWIRFILLLHDTTDRDKRNNVPHSMDDPRRLRWTS